MDIRTSIAYNLFKFRLKAIEKYTQQADEMQQHLLMNLLQKAAGTDWGSHFGYKQVKCYNEYKNLFPIQRYDDLKPFILRMIQGEKDILWPGACRWFAKSSGTTSDKSKFLPVTSDILHHCHYRGGQDTVALYLREHPDSRFFAGKGLILGGSHAPSALNSQAHCGDLSAVLLQNLSPLVNLIRVPDKSIILMDEWESKIKAIVENCYSKDVSSLSGVPSWMLVLIKAILARSGKSDLSEVWPNLEVFFHGGISFVPYREQYKALISSSRMHYMETYNASEGFFGIQNDSSDTAMLLMLDYDIFYEFIPLSDLDKENPTIVPLWEVETGKNYAMVITSSGGLWRYLIGDTIRFTTLHPYKFIITGRTKHFINAFGEELMVNNADKAISMACEATGAKVKEYTVAPLFLLEKAKGRHQWMIEFEKMPDAVDHFADVLDNSLQQVNSDYEAKRYKEISLQPLEIIVARPNCFYDWLKQKNKLGGQHKIPRLSNDRTILNELIQLNEAKTDA